jgi:TonB family protein
LLVATVALFLSPNAAAAPGITPPKRQDKAGAVYPPDGKGDATVVLALVVDAEGAVSDVAVREGPSPFVEAAVAAVRTWRFAPATRGDTPIAARIAAVVTFHAPSQAPPAQAVAPSPAPVPPASAGPAGAQPASAPEEIVQVAVKGEHEELGSIHIPRAETRFVPGAFGDPFRVIEALPGMAPWISGLPYFYVRGMSPENVGYFIDGIRVPLLFHVGAGPSTLAPALVDNVDLFPAAYPARYGHFAGAVIAGETTRPDEDQARGEFQVRVFDADAFVETPLDDGRGTALAAGRYGYTGLLTSLVAPDYGLGYWDYQFRVSHKVGTTDEISLFVFGAYDQLDYKTSPTFRVEYHRADLRYDHPVHEGNVRIAATFNYDDTLTALETTDGTGADAALRTSGGRLRAEFDERVSSQAWVRAGADMSVGRFTVDSYDGTIHPPHTDVVAGGYGDVVWRPAGRVEIVPGFRFDGYQVRDQTTLAPQPRLSARIKIAPGVTSIAAMGVAHQEPTDEVFVPARLPNVIDESPRESYQYSEALEVGLPSSVRLRGTVFYTLLRATTVAGREESAGVELFLRRDFSRRLGGFVSYTLSRAETTLNGQTLLSDGDRTHVLSVVLGYDLGNHWRVGARVFFESGRPYQAMCETPDCSIGRSLSTYSVTGRLPAFYRVDVRLEKRWLFARGRWLAGTLECFNALYKSEPVGIDYTPREGLSIQSQSPVILPSVGVEGGF